MFDEIVILENFEKSYTGKEIHESIEELKNPQEKEKESISILYDFNEKEMNQIRKRAMFKQSRHVILSIFIISRDYYELPKRTIRANGIISHILNSNNFRYVQNLNQDKASMDMTLIEFKFLTSTCGNENYQHLTFDSTKDK